VLLAQDGRSTKEEGGLIEQRKGPVVHGEEELEIRVPVLFRRSIAELGAGPPLPTASCAIGMTRRQERLGSRSGPGRSVPWVWGAPTWPRRQIAMSSASQAPAREFCCRGRFPAEAEAEAEAEAAYALQITATLCSPAPGERWL
jgi:hypothetical protein